MHIGTVDTSLASLRTAPDLGTLVRYVVDNPHISLHVAVATNQIYTKDALLEVMCNPPSLADPCLKNPNQRVYA